MKTNQVRAFLGLIGCATILMAAKCGGKGYATGPVIPGVGQEVPLVQVDGQAVPTVIASGATQTSVIGGKAILGEVIRSGSYSIVLQRGTGASAMTSTVSGTVVFDWESGPGVAANVDLGQGLGTHTFRFQGN
jgi:hypothetical protein